MVCYTHNLIHIEMDGTFAPRTGRYDLASRIKSDKLSLIMSVIDQNKTPWTAIIVMITVGP